VPLGRTAFEAVAPENCDTFGQHGVSSVKNAIRRRTLLNTAAGSVAACVLSACAHRTAEGGWTSHSRELESRISGLMRATNVPGVSVAAFQNGRIVWQRGFGVMDRESGNPVDTETMFEAASMSKPVFAYVVLKLCEEGVLDLDTPLTRYTRHQLIEDDSRLDLITARHILSHTSGLVPDWRSWDKPLKIAFNPGEKWSYSGEGYYYLQSVVTELTGRTESNQCGNYEAGLRVCATDFGEYMESKLVSPFGMGSSGYVWRNGFGKYRARPHNMKGTPLPYRTGRAVDLARYGAAGGLMTTPGDYAKFLLAIVDPLTPDQFHLKGSNLRQMTAPQIEVAKADSYTISWGLGWRIATTPHGEYFGHGGENPGFQCISEACAADRSGFVVMTNGDNGAKLLEALAPDISRRLHS
jgi:CubicO group peptidase (beta-lactamase class C family)